MPHKHKRKRENDKEHYDLPPTKLAKSLPSYEKVEKKHHKTQKGTAKPKPKRISDATKIYREDDTPRAFARMMHLQQANKKQRNGLDDGIKRATKKPKTTTPADQQQADEAADHAAVLTTASTLKILPGERLSDFAARVNQALPLSNIPQNRRKVGGAKERQTKTEKRLHKMYAEWRETDQKRKDKEEEFLEMQEEKDEELQNELGGQAIHLSAEGRKAKRQRMLTEATEKDDDPWAVLKDRREKPKGLHDVVQAPPELKAVKEKFKVRNGAKVEVENVPGKSGSLKRREELGQARKDVIERYRAMMKGKGGI
ncbi:hypothetical protein Slin15195_G032480 [Septoria linicola]|uniref:Uncharacterized protein n=1 Tax=Septoria linicola TaxID=215465 RepID=A0A9Q9AL12_9PEZI|nr:hypothetical protein Slin14017_G031510 [Septoria linicola]USW49929.1 hypothetical protein Slin15195_G032480 [Septoria linicola]